MMVGRARRVPVLANLFGTPRRVALGMGEESVQALREVGRLLAYLKEPEPPKGLRDAWDKLNPLAETGVGATQADEVPLRRFGKMDELRNLMIFLMSDGCSYITGDTISIEIEKIGTLTNPVVNEMI